MTPDEEREQLATDLDELEAWGHTTVMAAELYAKGWRRVLPS